MSSFLQHLKELTGGGVGGVLWSMGQWDIQAYAVIACDKILFLKQTFLNGNPFAVMYAVFQHWRED